MRYQKCYSLAYVFLIAVTLFAPEEFSVPLKYAFLPLMLMLVFGIAGNGIPLRLRIRSYALVCLSWIALTVYSTVTSDIVSWSPAARSFCLLILFFILLYAIAPDVQYMRKIKQVYVCFTLFTACWILLQFARGADRQNLHFISGQKDVNYLAAFMLPGVYMAMRFAFLEEQKHKLCYILCIITVAGSILLLQSRAAFITLVSVSILCFWEYMMQSRLTKRKLVMLAIFTVAIVALAVFMWNNPAFSRLTNKEAYKEDVRFEIWRYAMEAYRRSPIFGSGLGASNVLGRAGANHDTHNNYIDILGDTGILGMCMFLFLSFRLLKVRKGERLHMLSYFVACMLPLGFINGLQTISFWLPALLLAHEHIIIQREDPTLQQ
ncbi:MAG: O-antigen ligase family protein [Ruminococcaceae bacterium]|nr:O-antigen ligase family protein [Oscillospiraceae bacterium]